MLVSWTANLQNDIKLCVSSREDNIFMTHLSTRSPLRLPELTADDIEQYIRDKLKMIRPKKLEPVINEISSKADRIFFWVALAVRSIRSRLSDGCDIDEVLHEIETLANELDDLFTHLLNSITSSEKSNAYKTFQMVQLVDQACKSFWLWQTVMRAGTVPIRPSRIQLSRSIQHRSRIRREGKSGQLRAPRDR